MVKIRKGKLTRSVTAGAYANFYSKHGWSDVNGGNDAEIDENPYKNRTDDPLLGSGMQVGGLGNTSPKDDQSGGADDEDPDEDPNEDKEDKLTNEEVLEIPVSDMTTSQLKRAAQIIGYDYKAEGVKKTKVLREKMAQKLAAR